MVIHPDINPVQLSFTSVNGREPVFPFVDSRTTDKKQSTIWAHWATHRPLYLPSSVFQVTQMEQNIYDKRSDLQPKRKDYDWDKIV